MHDDAELEPALEAGATIVGVNNRNLRTLSVDAAVVRRSSAGSRPAWSRWRERPARGARRGRLRRAGYSAFLIGERLMTSADPGATLRALLGEAASA